MARKRPILRLLLLLIALTSTASFAQQSRVDTIVYRLTRCKTPTGIDTLSLRNTLNYILETNLTDEQVKQIEIVAGAFNQGTDEDLSYLIKFYVIDAILWKDPNKGIDYGKQTIANLERSRTPHVLPLKSIFLWIIRRAYRNSKRLPEGIYYYSEKINRYKAANDSSGLAACYFVLSGFYNVTGLLDQAIYAVQKSLSYMDTLASHQVVFFDTPNLRGKEAWLDNAGVLASFLLQKGEYQQALYYSTVVFKEWQLRKVPIAYQCQNIALARLLAIRLDSVAYFLDLGIGDNLDRKLYVELPTILQVKALYKLKIGKLTEAEALLNQCWQLIRQYDISYNTPTGTAAPDYYLALIRIQQKQLAQAAQLLINDISRLGNQRLDKLRDYKLLAEVYDKVGNSRQAAQAYQSFIRLQDSLLTDQNKFRSISFDIEQQMNDKDRSITRLQSDRAIASLYRNFTIGIAVLLLLLAATLYYRFRSKQRANAVLEKTLTKLKATQTQLIQKEKLASLGELTAGIAHEIQNPLNFVNNFSEVSAELVSELKEELDRGDTDEAKAIADDLMSNLRKIHRHGDRASSIIKGMLEHSRTESGEKRPTNLNTLADEYLKIAYHGFRAKDKTGFNCELTTDFDSALEPVGVAPQEIGRVLLNLYNNAFYAVNQRQQQAGDNYQPTVAVSTCKTSSGVELRVSDNGTGMPDSVKAKIFQPFFTTKPTGEGTGLGLSLSYDIITKGHGGTLAVECIQDAGTTFRLIFPVNESTSVF